MGLNGVWVENAGCGVEDFCAAPLRGSAAMGRWEAQCLVISAKGIAVSLGSRNVCSGKV